MRGLHEEFERDGRILKDEYDREKADIARSHDAETLELREMIETIDEEDFDYVALLRQPINLSSALGVDELLGRHSFEVRESHRPWAGSWWRQSEGALIFGYRNDYSGGNGAFPDLSSAMDTFSDIGRERFEEPAKELQKLAEELRTLRKAGSGDSEEYREMVADYRETQSGLVEVINTFYGAIQQACWIAP